MPFCYRFAEVHIVKRTNRLKCISLTNWINWGHLHSIYHKNKRYSLRVFKKLENIQLNKDKVPPNRLVHTRSMVPTNT